jgi:hypothetical protein
MAPETMLDVELLDALRTDTSVEGQRFRAVVRADVFDATGTHVVAERGAIVYGTVAQVAPAPAPGLVLDLDLVRTARGDATISAKLMGAKPVRVAGTGSLYDPATSKYDAVFTPTYPPGPSGYAAPGESVLYVDYYDEKARVLRLPTGAVLLFALKAPLAPALGPVPAFGSQEAPASSATLTAATVPGPPSAATAPGAETTAPGPVDVSRPTVLARAITRTIATTDQRVYFGDATRDALFAVSKAGGAPVEVGPHAPLDIALGPATAAWIGAPGQLLLRDPPRGGPLVARGAFTALVADGDDLYVTEAAARKGTLLHVTADKAVRQAEFESRPRDVAVDGCDVFVMTDDGIHRVPREGGDASLVAAGDKLTGLALDRDLVFATTALPTTRGLLRVPKRGDAAATIIVTDVRNGPIATWNGHVYYFDADTPTLMRIPAGGGAPTVVARSPELGWAVALTIDASGIYVAAAYERGGGILAFAHPT